MTTTIKITALTDIGANLAGTTLVPVVNMAGTPTTQRANVNNIANYVLNKATGANLGPVANVKITGGTAGQVLTTNGSNVLIWASGGNGTTGGSNTQVQFNDTGFFGGNSGFTFNKTTGILAVPFTDVSGVANIVGSGATVAAKSVLNVASTFGSNSSAEPASAQAIRGRVTGANLTKTRNYVTGVTGQYLITGTNASEFIKAGVLGVVGDQTTTADGAVVAYLDGDGGLTTANAAYAVSMKNSTPNSGFNYGLDLQFISLNLGGVTTSTFKQADIRFNNGVKLVANTANNISINANVTVGNIIATNLGNIAIINLDGNGSNVLRGNGTFAADANSSYGNSNVVSLMTAFGSNTITTTGNVSVGNIIGNGQALTGIAGANVSGFVPNANVANTAFAVAAANVSGLGNIATINLTGSTSNVLYGNGVFATIATSAGIANGTSNVTVPVSNGNVNIVSAGNTTIVVTDTGANITGTANISGNANIGNIGTSGLITATGNITGGNLIGPLANGNSNVRVASSNGNITVTSSGTNTWTFGTNGSLTLPIGVSIDSSVGPQYPKIIADSGKLFSVQGQGANGSAALAWTVDPNSASQYASVGVTRLGDNLAKVILTAQANSGDSANAKTWQFNETGNLTLPGNLVIAGNTSVFGTNASLLQPAGNLPLLSVSSGSNGGVSSLWVEDIGNVGTSNIAAVYTNPTSGSGIVRIAVGQNGSPGPNLWDFNANGTLTLPSGGNISTTGAVTANTANITTGNITTINSGLLQNGNSNITITSNGNVSIQAAGSNVELVVTSTGANVTGTFNATGNISGGNISATGNVSGTYLVSTNATGNEGGEISLAQPPNGNLSGGITIDAYQNTLRMFEQGGTARGLSVDIANSPAGGGTAIGYRDIPQVGAGNVTLAATDAGKHYYSTTAGNLTLTIPLNSTVPFTTGTAISIVVQAAGNILVNAASGVTLYMAGNSTAANRVVGGYGMATLMKVASDTWFINGAGVA